MELYPNAMQPLDTPKRVKPWGPLTAMNPSVTNALQELTQRTYRMQSVNAKRLLGNGLAAIAEFANSTGVAAGMVNEMTLLAYLRARYGAAQYGYLPTLPNGVSKGHGAYPYMIGGEATRSASLPVNSSGDDGGNARVSNESFAALSATVGVWDSGPWGQYLDGTPSSPGINFINAKSFMGNAIATLDFCATQGQGDTLLPTEAFTGMCCVKVSLGGRW